MASIEVAQIVTHCGEGGVDDEQVINMREVPVAGILPMLLGSPEEIIGD